MTLWNFGSDFGGGPNLSFDQVATAVAAPARECVDKTRFYLDTEIPGQTEEVLYHLRQMRDVRCPETTPEIFDAKDWELIRPLEEPDILPSPFGFILMGNPNSALLSRTHVQGPRTSGVIPKQQIRGTVHFVAPEKDGPLTRKSDIPTLTIHLKKDLGPGRPYPIDKSIKVQLNALGRLYIEDGRDASKPVERRLRASADFCQFPCYDFIVNDLVDKIEVKVRLSHLCTGLNSSNSRLARDAKSVKSVSLDIAQSKTVGERYKRYTERYKRSTTSSSQANYVLVQKGDGDNRLIVERLKHQRLNAHVQSMGFGSGSPSVVFSANLLFCFLVLFL